MKAKAWYARQIESMKDAMFGDVSKLKIELNKTHVLLPVVIDVNDAEVDFMLGQAFRYFNWIDFPDYVAPHEVQIAARKLGTHVSMSVGDVIELVDRDTSSYHIVRGVGWTELSKEDICK